MWVQALVVTAILTDTLDRVSPSGSHYLANRGAGAAERGATLLAPIVDVASVNAGANIERSACVSVAIRPGVAYECGDLRVAYSYPVIRTFNTARTITMLYNSQHAKPTPIVRALVTNHASGTAPTTVTATLFVQQGGTYVQRATATWSVSGWGADVKRQVALAFDASDLSTGLYQYRLDVAFTDGSGTQVTPVTGDLAIVNRSTSVFGAGWWVAGYERIITQANGDLFWIGGDGSTRRYARVTGTNTFKARTLIGRDSMTYSASTGVWYRHLTRGASTRFDSTGRHTSTSDVQGHVTQFRSYYCGRLGAVDLPIPAGYPYSRGWSFNYDLDGSPTPCTGQARQYNSGIAFTPAPAYRVLTRTIGSASGNLNFAGDSLAYTETNGRIATVRDSRGTTMTVVYGAGGLLTSTRTPTGVASDSVIAQFRAGEGAALASPDVPDNLYTALYSPRWPAVQAFTKLWLGPWGNPIKITDPAAQTTSIAPDDSFPLLAKRVTNPAGWSQYALYNTNGDLTYMNADPVGATGTPEWYYYYDDAAHPDNLTRARDAAGIWTTYTYGPVFQNYPGLVGVQNPTNAATLATFSYCAANTACAGLPRAVLSPQNAQGQRSRDSLAYDALGNLALTLSAGGKRTEFTNDDIGRVVSTRTLAASSPSALWVTTTTQYDALDRDTASTTTAPPGLGVTITQRLETRARYVGTTGLLASSRRWSLPDSSVGVLRDTTAYDALGRAIIRFSQGAATNSISAERLTYDAAGNVTRRVTPRGDTIRMEYDALNRLSRRLTPAAVYDSVRIGTAYNAPGDSSRSPFFPQFALGDSTYFAINSDEALFTYDSLSGQLARASNRDAIVVRTYDKVGRIIADTQTIRKVSGALDTTHVYGIRYEYDVAGRPTRLWHPAQLAPASGSGSETHTYTADTGLPWRLFDPLGGFIIFTFDPKGQLITQASPSGITRGFRYASDGEPVADSVVNGAVGARIPLPNPTGLARRATLTYDSRGKLLSMQNSFGRRENLVSTYAPMGTLRTSTFSTYGLGVTANAVVFSSSDTTVSDAFGNRIGGNSGTAQYVQSAPGNGVQFWLAGGGGSTLRWNTVNPSYDRSGNGRLLGTTVGNGGTSVLVYDSAGNTVRQTTAGSAQTGVAPAVEPSERFMYYDALGQLRAVDSRLGPVLGSGGNPVDPYGGSYRLTFDTYRYDALGRRVLARSQRVCPWNSPYFVWCALRNVRRTIWDGTRELYEIQMPDSAGWGENDTAVVQIPIALKSSDPTMQFDVSPFFGRVGYVYEGGALDKPLVVLRVHYRDNPYKPNSSPVVRWGFRTFQPFALYPLWDLRAEPALGSVLDGGLWPCETTAQSETRCTYPMAWTDVWHANGVSNAGQTLAWNGSLVEDKREGNGLSFRRARYLDPASGRFTQPDPIGLAGGLNGYGYAKGDPVNYADPFGLCPDETLLCQFIRGVGQRVAPLSAAGEVVGRIGLELSGAANLEGAIRSGSVGGTALALAEMLPVGRTSRGVNGLIGAAAGKLRGSGDIVVQGGRARAKELFREFDAMGVGNRRIVRDRTGGGRGVEGALEDGTPLRIRMKPDGTTRIQAGEQKFIFPPME